MKLNPLLAGGLGVAVAFSAVISFGFWIHKNSKFQIPDTVFAFFSVLLILTLSFFIQWILMGCPRILSYKSKSNNKSSHSSRSIIAEYRSRRIAELSLVPSRKHYIALLEKGEYWSDEQIEYLENKNLTATCFHLQDIEAAMRMAGIETKRFAGPIVSNLAARPDIKARCRIDELELKKRFLLPPSVKYQFGFQLERGQLDPWAQLYCQDCHSKIEVGHPDESNLTCFPT